MSAVLEVRNLKKAYQKGKTEIVAVDGISFEINKGECLGLVGESGCGKSTTAKLITRLTAADEGEIFLNGKEITHVNTKELRDVYKDIQMIFQMPLDSFNPRIRLGESVMESMINQGMKRRQAKARAQECLANCGLSSDFADRYPHQVSGGECQRASIARAIANKPSLLICDEATSALDVTIQSQILKLLGQFQQKMGMSCLLICHDLALVQEVCDRVMVMFNGRIVEEGTPDEIIMNPREEYTKRLIDSVL
ncbi:ATP-binding cassette domain-containing protein [Acetobacterium paludosum]|uniref:ATP-binding cassette domain-containing protein n=1 Tax=Acetobacterium paludosum TaxID=52693 RepID=A0A923HXN2_9FIRM|nr:ABC transporter ATP-binding protein [Acetobacterium paludosum]MBC3889060.1 ATP-binding cassette domain-containing protein [Acetobacterium paludosum]